MTIDWLNFGVIYNQLLNIDIVVLQAIYLLPKKSFQLVAVMDSDWIAS